MVQEVLTAPSSGGCRAFIPFSSNSLWSHFEFLLFSVTLYVLFWGFWRSLLSASGGAPVSPCRDSTTFHFLSTSGIVFFYFQFCKSVCTPFPQNKSRSAHRSMQARLVDALAAASLELNEGKSQACSKKSSMSVPPV